MLGSALGWAFFDWANLELKKEGASVDMLCIWHIWEERVLKFASSLPNEVQHLTFDYKRNWSWCLSNVVCKEKLKLTICGVVWGWKKFCVSSALF